MTEDTVLCVDLAAVDHDALHRAVEFSPLCFKLVAHIGGDGCFSSTRHTVERHVRRNVSVERFNQVEREFLNLAFSVREVLWTEVMAKDFLIDEQSFSRKEVIEDVSRHDNSSVSACVRQTTGVVDARQSA